MSSFQTLSLDPESKILFDPEQFKKDNPDAKMADFRIDEEESK